MATMNIYNRTGSRGDWTVAIDAGEPLATSIGSCAQGIDVAKKLAETHDVSEILLHRMSGTVTPISTGRRSLSNMLTKLPEIADGDAVYITRVQKNIDSDSKDDRQRDTLENAVKALPRKAHDFNWSSVDRDGFTSYVLDDGRIVSIEKTA